MTTVDWSVQKSRFSLSYIEAVASVCGYQVVEPKVDRDSVDGILMADFGRRPRIEFQAKATSQAIRRADGLHFPLEIKNYDDLRLEAINPRILIVLAMPNDSADWLHQTPDELALYHCAYWRCLEAEPETQNRNTITVHLPEIFGRQQLMDMMQKTERGEALC